MELGNFLGKLKGQDKAEPKKFLALILTDEVVQAAVWSVVGEQTEVIAIGSPVEWDGDTGTTRELVTAVDATISSAVEGLSSEPNSVILGIPHSWTDKNGVLGVKREFITKIRKELELEAIGYVVITDSILSYLKMQEGTPTTSILIQVSRDELTLVLVRLGRIEVIETIGRSDDVVEDVTEGIARFKIGENLPSRIILFNSMHNLDDIIQNLLSVNWQTEFNFLHTPKIEALSKDIAIRALSVAGGAEVAKSLGFTVSAPVSAPVVEEIDPVEPPREPEPEPEILTAEEIGFVEPPIPSKTTPTKIDFIDPDDEPTSPAAPAKTPTRSGPLFVMPKISFPKISLPKFHFNLGAVKSHWWMIGSVLLLLGVIIYWLVWLLPSATLNIRVLPKTLDQDVELTLSTTDSSINFADKIVPASIETVTESGQNLIETTGKKIVGDPAKGTVTIYNRTSAVKTLAKGTSLSAGSLKFTLDQDVLVASKSAGSDYVDVPGKSSVPLTAASIGTESNLSPGTEFTIQSFGKDSYVGKNEAALAGGTSEEVQVVGKDDQQLLTKDLTTQLLQTLTTKSGSSSTPGTGIYLIVDSTKIDDVTYSAKVGETAKTLTANLTIKVSLLKYRTDDVTTLVNSEIDQAVPSGFVRADLPSTVELSASVVSEDETKVKGNAQVKVALLPVIDHKALQSALSGKGGITLENTLRSMVPGYVSAEAQIAPRWIPTRLKFIPRNPKNIKINIMPAL